MLENRGIDKNTKLSKVRKKCLLKNIKTELNKLENAGKENQFSNERIGKMPTTKPYSNKTKIKSPGNRGL